MTAQETTAIATTMIAFSTFLGVGFALLYYLFLILKLTFPIAIIYGMIYIVINTAFLYFIIRWRTNEK